MGLLYEGPYEDFFPVSSSIPSVAQDGNPFANWDGVTQFYDSKLGWIPSKSSTTYITVKGTNSLHSISMTRNQLMEWFWRVSKINVAVKNPVKPSITISGSDVSGTPGWTNLSKFDNVATNTPWSYTMTLDSGISDSLLDCSGGTSFKEADLTLNEKKLTVFSDPKFGKTFTQTKTFLNDFTIYPANAYNSHITKFTLNSITTNTDGTTISVPNVIFDGSNYWLFPFTFSSTSNLGLDNFETYKTTDYKNAFGYKGFNTARAAVGRQRYYTWGYSQLTSGVSLYPIPVKLTLSNSVINGVCYLTYSYADGSTGFTYASTQAPGSSVTFTDPGPYSIEITANQWFSYDGVWNTSTGLPTGT